MNFECSQDITPTIGYMEIPCGLNLETIQTGILKRGKGRKTYGRLGNFHAGRNYLRVPSVDAKIPKPLRFKKYFKGQNLAFPREIVFKEVERIIDAHMGILPKCDENFKKLMIGNWREVPIEYQIARRFTFDRGCYSGSICRVSTE
ncbi:MAG: hypothetical protein ACLUKN_14080 [Bacilli bacterium]